MLVALDANVLIADPWLKSREIAVLLDYLEKTDGEVLLLESVEIEVTAHIARGFQNAADGISGSLKNAERQGLRALPRFSAQEVLGTTLEAWRTHFSDRLGQVLRRVPMNPSVLRESFLRAAERRPPCSDSGREMRDAVIWLSLLQTCQDQREDRVAFITQNTRDFAAPDKTTLKESLLDDTRGFEIEVAFFSSLNDFLRIQAEPYLKITKEWLTKRLDYDEIAEELVDTIGHAPEAFHIVSVEYRDSYEPVGEPNVTNVGVDIKGFYVWEFESGRTEVMAYCTATLEADIDCDRTDRQRELPFGERQRDSARTRTLACVLEVGFQLIAQIDDTDILSHRIEDVEPL